MTFLSVISFNFLLRNSDYLYLRFGNCQMTHFNVTMEVVKENDEYEQFSPKRGVYL